MGGGSLGVTRYLARSTDPHHNTDTLVFSYRRGRKEIDTSIQTLVHAHTHCVVLLFQAVRSQYGLEPIKGCGAVIGNGMHLIAKVPDAGLLRDLRNVPRASFCLQHIQRKTGYV